MKNFCSFCGKKLVLNYGISENNYNEFTGKPCKFREIICPERLKLSKKFFSNSSIRSHMYQLEYI